MPSVQWSATFQRAETANTRDMLSSLETGDFSDLKIVSGDGKEFNVHKVVMCTQSQFFRAACTVDMKVSVDSRMRTRVMY